MFQLFGRKKRDKEKAEAIIKAVHAYYETARSRYPGKREIFYLALAWGIYVKKHHAGQYTDYDLAFLLVPASGDTAIFSFLHPPDSIEALALFMVHKERLRVATEYEAKFNEIMGRLQVTDSDILKESEGLTKYLLAEGTALEGTTIDDF